jgi:hypothetical protein
MAQSSISSGSRILDLLSAAWRLVGDGRSERLVVFTRYPEPGRTKSRLAPVLGPEGAASLQRQMTTHMMRHAGAAAGRRGARLEVRYEGGSSRLMNQWLGPGVLLRPQGDGDLGSRMARTFEDAFREGADAAVIVGSDCPEVGDDLLDAAFEELRCRDLVVGPAADGGYYLIGLRRRAPDIFEGVEWGTGEVLGQTMALARRAGLSTARLRTLSDVDRPEDLAVWERAASEARRAAARCRLSVVVATLNEAANIERTLGCVRRAAGVEVVVADGGSEDGTADLARARGALVMDARRGRALQMNAGAAAAGGETLLFLHGDTCLPWGFERCVEWALGRPGAVAGAFAAALDGDHPGLRAVEWLISFRSRHMRMPYGDQALFLRRAALEEAGGFPEMRLMADYEFVRRLRRRGRIVLVRAAVLTDARRWMSRGVLARTLRNQLVIAAYHAGVPLEDVARLYG